MTNEELFKLAVSLTMSPEVEGGHNPNDHGSDTWFGIRQVDNPDMSWPPTFEQAVERARIKYWKPYHFDRLPPALACAAFDWIFNGGPAISTLQKLLGVEVDGMIGPRTGDAAAACNVRLTLERYLAERCLYYIGLHSFTEDGRTWLRRAIHFAMVLTPVV